MYICMKGDGDHVFLGAFRNILKREKFTNYMIGGERNRLLGT